MRVVLLLCVSLLLAGCTGDDEPAETTQTPADSMESVGNVTADPADPAAQATVGDANVTANEPPVLGLNHTVLNGTAPWNVQLNITGEDADPLTWTVHVGDEEVANGTDFPATVNVSLEVGVWNITVALNDGMFVVNQTLTAHVLAGGPDQTPVTADDDGDDGYPFLELLGITAQYTEAHLEVVLTLDSVWPSTSATSPISYSVYVGGHQYDSFVRYPIDNPMTWDATAGGYMAGGTSSWTDTTVTFFLPLEHLAERGTGYPTEVSGSANVGTLLAIEPQDYVPNDGTITVG